MVKKILISAFSILLVGASLFIDEQLSLAQNKSAFPEIQIIDKGKDSSFTLSGKQYQADAGAISWMTIVFRGNAILRLAPKSKATFTLSTSKDAVRKVDMRASNGRFWINTVNSGLDVILHAGSSEVNLKPGLFDAQYGNSIFILSAVRHSGEVKFLSNSLVLPEGRQITISEAKIAAAKEAISKLRYSKLSKEFPYYEMQVPDEWTLLNKKSDTAFFNAYKKKILEGIRNEGASLPINENSFLFKTKDFLKTAKGTLALTSSKKSELLSQNAWEYFDSAVYAMLIGKEDIAKIWISKFQAQAMLIPASALWDESVISNLDRFAFIKPDDPLFPLQDSIRNVARMNEKDELRFSFNDVLDTASNGKDEETRGETEKFLRVFGSVATEAVKKGLSAADLFSQTVAYNDFLNRNTPFLKEQFLSIAELFERSYLAALTNKEEANDQEQYLIAEKLKVINMLKNLMTTGNMQFQDARKGILLIARQIDGLKPQSSAGAAVLSYFDNQLNEMGPFIAFLRSSEAANLHGSFQENYADFKLRMEEMKKVTELLSNSSGGVKISPFRREEIAAIIATDLSSVHLENVKIALPEVDNDALVKIVSAKFHDKAFSGMFDTERKLFSGIVFDAENVPYTIHLDNLEKFLLVKTGQLVLQSGVGPESFTEQANPQSLLQKVATESLLSDMNKAGIDTEEKYLNFENLDNGIVHVKLASIGKGSEMKAFAFDIEQKTGNVSKLKVQTVLGELPVNDKFALSELTNVVTKISQNAVFEKQKAEEMKKLTEELVGTSTKFQ